MNLEKRQKMEKFYIAETKEKGKGLFAKKDIFKDICLNLK